MQTANPQPSGELSPKRPSKLLIALGANLTSSSGAPSKTLFASLKSLKSKGALIRAVSPFYSTFAFPAGNGPDFVNAAAVIEADWDPQTALGHMHAVEAAFGRKRGQRWGQRTLDIDLIACGDMVLPDAQTHRMWREMDPEDQKIRTPDQLILPHPRLQDRAFVLIPLADVAPDWRHPLLDRTVSQMLAALPDAAKKGVRPL